MAMTTIVNNVKLHLRKELSKLYADLKKGDQEVFKEFENLFWKIVPLLKDAVPDPGNLQAETDGPNAPKQEGNLNESDPA
jgi:hypothetical protein